MGCSSGGAPTTDGKANLEILANHYLQFAGANKKMAPPTEAAFKAYLTKNKVEKVEELFVSPRDKQPYIIKYAISLAEDPSKISLGPDAQPKIVIIHEKEGSGGKKYVALQSNQILEVEDPTSVK
jgi:hypothetical protein